MNPTVPPDATAAEKRVALSANEAILRLAGSFESEVGLSPVVSIGQLLINLDHEHGRASEPWEIERRIGREKERQ